jgi:hypothetical protein
MRTISLLYNSGKTLVVLLKSAFFQEILPVLKQAEEN